MKKCQVAALFAVATVFSATSAPLTYALGTDGIDQTTIAGEVQTTPKTAKDILDAIIAIQNSDEYKAYPALKEAHDKVAADGQGNNYDNMPVVIAAISQLTGVELAEDSDDLAVAAATQNIANYAAYMDLFRAYDECVANPTNTANAVKFQAMIDKMFGVDKVDVSDAAAYDAAFKALFADADEFTAYHELSKVDAYYTRTLLHEIENIAALKEAYAATGGDIADLTAERVDGLTGQVNQRIMAFGDLKDMIDGITIDPSQPDADRTTDYNNLVDAATPLVGDIFATDTPVVPVEPVYVERTLTNAEHGVTVKGQFKENAEYILEVVATDYEVTGPNFYAVDAQAVYDITIKEVINGVPTVIDLDGQEVEVSITVPAGLKGELVEVYHIVAGAEDENGDAEIKDYTQFDVFYNAENNTVNFTTDHFSFYALIQPSQPDEEFGGFGGDDEYTIFTPVEETKENGKDDKTAVKTPNTGIVAKSTTGSAAGVNATAGIVAAVVALAGAAIAMIARFVRRQA